MSLKFSAGLHTRDAEHFQGRRFLVREQGHRGLQSQDVVVRPGIKQELKTIFRKKRGGYIPRSRRLGSRFEDNRRN